MKLETPNSPPPTMPGRPLTRSRITLLIVFFLPFGGSAANPTVASSLEKPEFEPALRAALPTNAVPTTEILRALPSALWNSNRTAVALALRRPAATLVYVFLRKPDDTFQAVEVSAVESGNFGKLGRPRNEYTRFETLPVRWLPREDGHFQVMIETRAWRGRQRYRVSEPLVIRADGTPMWR